MSEEYSQDFGPVEEIPVYRLTAASHWRARLRQWKDILPDEEGVRDAQRLEILQDIVYSCVLRGADKRDIIEFFGLRDNAEFGRYLSEVIRCASAERRMTIKSDIMELAFIGRSTTAKMFVAKALGGLIDAPPPEALPAPAEIKFTVVTNDNPEINQLRAELDDLCAAAGGEGL